MNFYVLGLQDIDRTKLRAVGGKGANLGELARMGGIHVPAGFCVTTNAFKRIVDETPSLRALLDQLSLLTVADRHKIRALSAEIREVIEAAAIPEEISDEINRHLASPGAEKAYAVRSSATAEDLPAASFAGQQDTFLNVKGSEAILAHISKCWASLYTERAVIYRIQNGFDHHQVHLAVVVQAMIFADVSGVMFTADPVTSNRKVLSIDASFGLGEALVSGKVNPDIYQVRDGKIIDKQIAIKELAVSALDHGGTKVQQIDPQRQSRPALTDGQILALERIGRSIEAHFGSPQDIEWCLVDNTFSIVQSRPITTLYPIPAASDRENHVYVSVGHQQMMTDPMTPLGLSFFQLTAGRPMYAAGGRLFVDVAPDLASPAKREILVNVLGKSDPLVRSALTTILERGDFIKMLPEDSKESAPPNSNRNAPPVDYQTQIAYDPGIVAGLIDSSQESIAQLQQEIRAKSGVALLDFVLEDIQKLKKSISDPRSFGVIMTAMNASTWINEKLMEWLGEKNAVDTLTQSAPNNVTSEMGLALLDVADVIRSHAEVIDYLGHANKDAFSADLVKLEGGPEAWNAISAYLDKYGMRCAGEIDITRTRWREKPAMLVPALLSNVRNFEPGAASRRFEQGLQQAQNKEKELLARLSSLPGGEAKAEETKRMIELVRNYIGYREYPKYSIVSRYFIYKQALLKEAVQLVQADVIRESEDIYYLSFEELREVVRIGQLDYALINTRRDEHKHFERLSPPRVMTSDGEIIAGEYKRENLPAGALIGLPVSSGIVEGRARVILKMEDAVLEEGDILVTVYTDPSWTPLFVAIKGLVTEVGGLMSHGAVIAREYGLPAVVGVGNATGLIEDGQQIRVHGTDGYVELLSLVPTTTPYP